MDARRNLESVLRAAREVFGELGYGAPMEEVARRAGVGVGTVYRRFPSKEVLVRRIAAEEVAWLTAQARDALSGGRQPWDALAGYLSRAVSSGAGRLLPPEAFRYAEALARVPRPRADQEASGTREFAVRPGGAHTASPSAAPMPPGAPSAAAVRGADGSEPPGADPAELLALLGELVERSRESGELRSGVTVVDVVLVLTASVPAYAATPAATAQPAPGPSAPGMPPNAAGGPGEHSHSGFRYPHPDGAVRRAQPPDPGGTAAPSRLLRILLDGLRSGENG